MCGCVESLSWVVVSWSLWMLRVPRLVGGWVGAPPVSLGASLPQACVGGVGEQAMLSGAQKLKLQILYLPLCAACEQYGTLLAAWVWNEDCSDLGWGTPSRTLRRMLVSKDGFYLSWFWPLVDAARARLRSGPCTFAQHARLRREGLSQSQGGLVHCWRRVM